MKRLILLPALLFAACGGKHETPASEKTEAKPITLKVETVAIASLPVVYRATGTVEARTRSTIAAQIMGSIREVRASVGQQVRAGQTLLVIDAQQLQSATALATAASLEARSALPEADHAIDAAKAQLALAQSTYNRMNELFAKRSLSAQEMDEANARVKQAQSAVAMAEARRSQVQARISQSEQAVTSAKVAAGYTTITAPFDGIVTEKQAQPGSMAVPGQPLLTIERAAGYRLEIPVEESQASGIRLGSPLRIIWDDSATPTQARVSEIVPSLDPSTRTLTVKADLPAIPGLRSGRFARAEWTVGERQVLSVPATAVRESGQLQLVFVIDGGHVRSRMISAGDAAGSRREVLAGLKPGESVVISPALELADGAPAEAAK